MDIFNEEIRALSWKEPFASLMLHGKIETRTWDTKYQGLVLICASKIMYGQFDVQDICGRTQFERIFSIDEMRKKAEQGFIHRGAAIAIGRLVASRPMRPGREDEDKCFVKYNGALWCHHYEDVQAIEPFSWKGSQGWKKLTDQDKLKIKFL